MGVNRKHRQFEYETAEMFNGMRVLWTYNEQNLIIDEPQTKGNNSQN